MKHMLARTHAAVAALIALTLAAVAPAQAALQVDITDSSQSAIPIAIAPFGSSGGALPVDVAQVASDDLESTGLFDVTERRNMAETPTNPNEVNYQTWRSSSVDNLVVGSASANGQGGYRITFDLLDVYQGKSIASFQINAGRNELRDAAHTVANLIYEKFVGEKGYFLSRIAYITMAKENGALRYRLIVSDYDGKNPATVYSSRDPIMSPAWSPDGTKLAYVAFDINRGRSSLRVQDLATGNIREISSREGINGAPAWSPDGRHLAMTLSYRGNPDIYSYDLTTNQLTQLTNNGAIDTEAAWSADGRHIAFTSDRGGKPQVYQMRSDGSQVQRLTFEGDSNQRATYSPDGNQIAMVQKSGNGFRIAVMDLQNNNIRIVSDGPLDDGPDFAPNGQAIIYARQGRNNELATVSTDGQTRSRLSQSGEVREPAWGPLGY